MPKAHVSTNEILEAIHVFSNYMEKRVNQLEVSMESGLEALEKKMDKRFADQATTMDAIAKTVQATREEVSAWHGRAERTEQQVQAHEKKIGAMQMHFGIKFE